MLLFQVILVVLFLLAITDLTVGVANDAVNFLNPSIGSRAAKMKLLFVLVSVGVVIGATFASGMMEVARKGIFNPDNFYFNEVMFIFLAVMLTDVLLLDAYNTLGLPTSTTVSLVFALLGASVSMALIKIYTQPDALAISEYINTSKALAIISGILISIVVAFSVGALVQWLARLLFSFNYDKRMKYLGAIFGGIAITIIVYFMLIKGLKGASFMTPEMNKWVATHTLKILLASFVGFTILFEVLYLLFRINILKVIVLTGTITLAMAFAGNDLVNFIGVPMAGLASYQIFTASGATDTAGFTMQALSGPIQVQTYFLIAAGLVMVAAIWFSKKSRTVIKTSVELSRQSEGHERFGSSLLAREIVRMGVGISHTFSGLVPASLKRSMAKQFEPRVYTAAEQADRPAFDMLRASISLIVASILIALGTSLKLPLSTTYVTFMVAMATSFADKSWGRESAVYRITGVLSVIGGWFITAIVAFLLSAVILAIVYFGGIIAVAALVLIAVFFFIRSNIMHKRREEKQAEVIVSVSNSFTEETKTKVSELTSGLSECYTETIDGICDFKLKKLKKRNKRSKEIDEQTVAYKNEIYSTLSKTGISFENSGVFYVQMIDYLREASDCLKHITNPAFEHVNNNHKELTEAQVEGLRKISSPIGFYLAELNALLLKNSFEDHEKLHELFKNINTAIENVRSEQIKRIRSKQDPTRSSMLVINIMQETQNFVGDLHKMAEAYIKFRLSF
ncbi:MAG TPA: inorganic phosphate transporter [Bacteroidales bacterium]|nr:inorganic phosphate transporter [Bacteroidales bacterium]